MVLVTPIDRSSELVLPSPERTHTEGDSTCITAVAPPKKDGLSILSNTTMQSTATDHSPNSSKEVEQHPFYKVEVSVQGLQGFQQPQEKPATGVEGEDLMDVSIEPPNRIFGAAIAFGGSSKRNNIQVGSSSVCGQTGHLLVESEEVTDRTQIKWSVQDKQPHMSMVIPVSSVQTTSDTTPTSVIAPTSNIQEEKKDEDVPMDISFNDDSDNMSASSAGWSLLDSSDKHHPDNVVEVLLRLKQSAQTEAAVASYWDGVAYLIVPPRSGRHVVSVPIQIPKTSTQPRSVSGSSHGPASAPRLSVSPLEGATLNIVVDVIPTDECPNTKDDSMTMDSSLVTPVAGSPRVPVTPDSDDSPIEEKIRASEERALQDFEAERAAATRSNRITPEQTDQWSLALLWDTLFQSCDLDQTCFGALNEQHDSDDLMDNSTIATRPSLGI